MRHAARYPVGFQDFGPRPVSTCIRLRVLDKMAYTDPSYRAICHPEQNRRERGFPVAVV